MIDVSIIIVNWNSWDDLKHCLSSLRDTVKKSIYEIIVIDNASKEDRRNEVQSQFSDLPLQMIRNEENMGFAIACNQGMRQAKGQWRLLLNPDTIVLEGAIDACVFYMRQHLDVGVLGCRLLNEDGSTQLWTGGKFPSLRSAFNHFLFLSRIFPSSRLFQGLYLSKDITGIREVDWVCGAFLMVRSEAALEVGELREDYFMYAEDIEWCYRMIQSNWKVIYFPQAKIIHASGKSMAQLTHARYWKGLHSTSVFYRSHGGNRMSGPLFDVITSLGYFLRAIFFGAISIALQKNSIVAKKARDSWGYFFASLHILFRRNTQASAQFKAAVS